MYGTGPLVSGGDVPAGTTLLVRGPPLTHKQSLVIGALAGDDDVDTATIFVATDDSPATLWADYRAAADATAPGRIGIVDATGQDHDEATTFEDGLHADGGGTPLVGSVSSPADLTGIGIEVSRLLQRLVGEQGLGRVRVAVCNLQTMAMYADEERITKFVHAFDGRIAEVGGFGVITRHTGDAGIDENRLPALVDGVTEVREAGEGDGIEVRTRGLGGDAGWRPVTLPDEAPARTGTEARAPSDVPDSLAAVLDAVERERQTVTVCNGDAGAETMATLESYFDARNVAFRETTLGTATPRNVALLHRGDQVLGSAAVSALADALAVDDDTLFAERERPALLRSVDRLVHGARGVDTAFLVDVSRVFEMGAFRTGAGRIHAGFQSLSRLWDDPRTRRIYERLAGMGVDVHVYGTPDGAVPSDTGLAVHGSDAEEIATCWFVVFDGDGHDDRTGALLVEETAPDVYDGFWTRTPERVDALDAYLQRTYVD